MPMFKFYEKPDGTLGKNVTVAGATAQTLARNSMQPGNPGVGYAVMFFQTLSRPMSEVSEVIFDNAFHVAPTLAANTTAIQGMMNVPLTEEGRIVWKPDEEMAEAAAAEAGTGEAGPS
jgi:hypothetical protein